jgi:exopolysaccharide production protein ExoZ
MSTQIVESDTVPLNSERLAYLEVGRGLAALLVVCFHATGIIGLAKYFGEAPLNGIFSFGDAGVDFFFVLSGFIIYYSTSANHGNLRWAGEYLKHRLVRIYPIYWLVALLLLPMGAIFGHWPGVTTIFKDLVLLPHGDLPFVPVAWTLRHEMLFYISFLLFFINIRLAWVYFLLWTFLIASECSGNFLGWGNDSAIWKFYLDLHNIEFVLGILTAAYIRQSGWVPFWCLPVGCILFLGSGINQSILNKDIITLVPQYHLIYGFSSVFLLARFATLHHPEGALVQGFAFLGKASYSIYLIHFAVLSAIVKLLIPIGLGAVVSFIILVLSGLIIGSLFYQYVERPLLKFTKQKMKIVNKRLLAKPITA